MTVHWAVFFCVGKREMRRRYRTNQGTYRTHGAQCRTFHQAYRTNDATYRTHRRIYRHPDTIQGLNGARFARLLRRPPGTRQQIGGTGGLLARKKGQARHGTGGIGQIGGHIGHFGRSIGHFIRHIGQMTRRIGHIAEYIGIRTQFTQTGRQKTRTAETVRAGDSTY